MPMIQQVRSQAGDPIATSGALLLSRNAAGAVIGSVLNTPTTEPIGKYEACYGLEQLSGIQRRRSPTTRYITKTLWAIWDICITWNSCQPRSAPSTWKFWATWESLGKRCLFSSITR